MNAPILGMRKVNNTVWTLRGNINEENRTVDIVYYGKNDAEI